MSRFRIFVSDHFNQAKCFLLHQLVPVHVLPKLEYQLSYGVECLTRGEACQLWTETLLHSSTISYIGKYFIKSTSMLCTFTCMTGNQIHMLHNMVYSSGTSLRELLCCSIVFLFPFPSPSLGSLKAIRRHILPHGQWNILLMTHHPAACVFNLRLLCCHKNSHGR